MGRLASSTLMAKKVGPMDLGFYVATAYAARNEVPKHPQDDGIDWAHH